MTSMGVPETAAAPAWQLPKFDWGKEVGAVLGQALRRAGAVSFVEGKIEGANNHCPFVSADACAVAWHGGVSPCPPLLHSYSCFVKVARSG